MLVFKFVSRFISLYDLLDLGMGRVVSLDVLIMVGIGEVEDKLLGDNH